ncbi:alpha-scruin [Caerostris extrusa]|uniref:Alpha-scruin n=1 Tax=Caerostris extrusa TaxID=172846 RepID=A0AAV4VLN5_CAEEX|nr:alpha-scruin [Caerostris extrusa]
MVATQSTFQLTVRSKRWRRRADMHQARACHATVVVQDSIMVFGGRDNSGKILSSVEIYLPKRDLWSLAKPMPEPIMGMACSVMDECVWIIGGVISEGGTTRCTISNRVYAFDIPQQNWYHKASLFLKPELTAVLQA